MTDSSRIPPSRHIVFWGLALGGCLVDLAVKSWVFSQPDLQAGKVWWAWPGHVGLQLSLNEGALFGMGQGKAWWFAACAILAVAAVPVWLFAFGGARDLALTVVLGCILGGVLGNLYDRVGLPGLQWNIFDPRRAGEPVHAVRDFVLVAWQWDDDWTKRIVWPNFNIADSLLVCGAIALVVLSFRTSAEPGSAADVTDSNPPD